MVKPLISSSEATARLSAAGALLVKADEAVGPLRADLAKQPGHAQLERSVFLTARSLVSPSSMASLVDQLTSSSSLAVVHDLSITAVSLTPAALPTPGATSTNLPPTTRLVVTVVVANAHSSERGVQLVEQCAGRCSTRRCGLAGVASASHQAGLDRDLDDLGPAAAGSERHLVADPDLHGGGGACHAELRLRLSVGSAVGRSMGLVNEP